MDIALQTTWGWEIATYLFLGGLAAGTLCVASIINLTTKDKFKNTVSFSAWAGAVFLIMGVFFLLLEVGVPFRAIILYQSFVNFESWMMVGAWLLVLGIVIYIVYALSCTDWVTNRLRFLSVWRTPLAVIAVMVSLGIAIYTGLLLSVLYAVPLWNTLFLPALFTVSALDTGVAFVSGYAMLRESKLENEIAGIKKSLELSTIVLVILEVIVLASYLGTISSLGGVATSSVEILTSGALSQLFWVILIGCGLAIPLIVSIILLVRGDLASKTWGILPSLASALCIAGGLTLRFLILFAGLPIYT